jgi:hypothetical protein
MADLMLMAVLDCFNKLFEDRLGYLLINGLGLPQQSGK